MVMGRPHHLPRESRAHRTTLEEKAVALAPLCFIVYRDVSRECLNVQRNMFAR